MQRGGLPLLAKGEDETLKAAAKKDLARPATVPEKAEIGHAWYNLGDGYDLRERTQARCRAFQWYYQAAPMLTGLPKDRVNKRLDELKKVVGAGTGVGGWRILFRSSDPASWNTDTMRGWDHFAVLLSRVPSDIRYLKMTETYKGEFVIVEITRSRLADAAENDGYGWNGTKTHRWNGYHLGIYDMTRQQVERGGTSVYEFVDKANYRGWGFGHRTQIGDQQGYCWAGESIDKTVFEIAVKSTALTPDEAKHLLKK